MVSLQFATSRGESGLNTSDISSVSPVYPSTRVGMLAASSVIALPPDYLLAGGDVAEMQQVQGAYPYPCMDDQLQSLEPDMQLEPAPEVHHTPAVHRKHGHKKHRREGGGHTRPHTKKGAWSEEEEMTLAVHHREVGNKWAAISKFLPLRSDNDVKNHWNSTLRSKSAVKHTTFLWLYAKEVESVADCEEARCRSFDTALRMYEELKAHLQLQQLPLAEEEGVPLGDAADDGTAPSSLEAGGMPAAALPGLLLPKQEEQVLQAAVGVVMDAPSAPGVMQGHAGSTPRSMPNSPMKPATCWEGAHGAAAAMVEAETEDSQCLSAEHMAVPQPLSSKGACYASSSLPEQCMAADQPTAPGLQVASPRSRAPSAAAAELARAASGPRALPRGTWAGASSVRGGLMFGPREGEGQGEEEEEEDGEGLLLEMPRASPAPWSLHELSDDLPSMQLPSMQQQQQQEACSAARASCEGAAVAHAKLQLADLHLAMQAQPQLHAPRTPGGVPQPTAALQARSQSLHSGMGMALQRDPSGSPTNSLAGLPASWALGEGGQVDTTLAGHDAPQPAGSRPADGMRSSASGSFRTPSSGFHSGGNSGFMVSGDAPSPSPPPPAVTPSLQASRWLMSAGGNADGSGLPPGLSGEVIAQDLQDHTFDGLDVNTFLCMRARAHARHTRQGAQTSPRSDDGGNGRGTAGNAEWGVVPGPDSRDVGVEYGPCSMDVDTSMQQLGSGECGGASPQDVAMQQHSLQQLQHQLQQQQQQQQQQGGDVVMHEGGMQEGEEEEEEALRCRLLLSAMPDAACSPPGLLQSDPLMLYGMPACGAAVPAAFQLQQAGGAAAAGDEPASSRSRNSCSAAATPFHPLAAWSPFNSGAQATGETTGQQNTVASVAAARRGSSNSCSSGMLPGAAFAWPKPAALLRTPRAATSPAAAAAAAGAALAKYASCTAACEDTPLAPMVPASRSMLRATASMTERLAQQLQLQQLQVQKLAEDAAAWADAAERLCKPAPAAAPAVTKRAEPGACGSSSSSLAAQAGAAGVAAGSGSAGPSRNGSSSPMLPTTLPSSWETVGHSAPTGQQACAAAELRDAATAGMHADARQQVLKFEGAASRGTFHPLQRCSMPGERSQYAIKEEEPADCLLPGAVAPAAAAADDGGGVDMGMWPNMACTSPSGRRGSRVLSFSQLGTGAFSQLGVDGLHSVTTGVAGPLCGGKRKSDGHLATCAEFAAMDDAADGRPAVRTCTPRGPRSTPGCVYPTSGRRSFDTAFMASHRASSAYKPNAASPTQAMRPAGSFAPAASSFGPASWCIQEQQEEPLAASHPLVTSGFGGLDPHSSLSPRGSAGVMAADPFAASLPMSRASLDGSTPAGGGFGRSPRMGGMPGNTRVIIHQPPAWY